jgi:hypothetical protein
MELTPIERMMAAAKVQMILHKVKQEKPICQWCFEEPALEGKTVCQACIDSFIEQQEEYPSFDLDDFLEETEDET